MSDITSKNPIANAQHAQVMQVVVFKLGQEEYGLPIHQIKEVVTTPTVTCMPQTPPFVKGVANVRGNIIAMLDLEEKFGLVRNPENGSKGNKFTLVIESEDYKMGILVREVPNTLSILSTNIEDSVFTGDHQSEQSYITGIVKLEKRLIIMIDIFKVINEQEAQKLFKEQDRQPVTV
ncbi:MAG: chemotaxis protein CheW [Chryseolinea sp.]